MLEARGLLTPRVGSALVQLSAPPALRGHVIGVYAMAAWGLR
jgi:hypothetical protein